MDSSNFCDECGNRLISPPVPDTEASVPSAAYVPPRTDPSANLGFDISRSESKQSTVTSVGIPPIPVIRPVSPDIGLNGEPDPTAGMNAILLIERGDAPGIDFLLNGRSAIIGRWDADNGIFPDVDLDQHDSEAKVSRKHARISFDGSKYMIEDLGSTNGTYINRGKRLLPGTPQQINNEDEIIVGKTFLRFRINS